MLVLLAVVLSLPGCTDQPLLRDYYLGKSILQPGKVPRPVPRDAYGNAVLDTKTDDAEGIAR